MTIEEIKGEGIVQLKVEGRIDAMTSTEFQNAILKAFQKSNNVIVDMREVAYISSAGLRGLMIGQKTASSKGGKFTLINAGESVLEVLRVTGLDKAFDIR